MQTSLAHEPTTWPSGQSRRSSMSDLLLRIARDRSGDAFEQLFEEYGPRLRAYMMRNGADIATAEELAQETMLTVWRKASLYSASKGTPAAWIFTIARNLRIDRVRREVAWQELPEGQAEARPSDEIAPDDAVGVRQRQARVQVVLAELPALQRQIVTLAFIDGLSHGEIAEKLSIPLGTVKSRMRLAYQKMRDALEDLK